MAQYIDKSAVVSEIEKEIKEYATAFSNMDFKSYEAGLIAKGKYRMSQEVLSFLNTLEVKEVDFEKEFDNYTNGIMACDVQFVPFTHLYECAKHFYELGMAARNKAQKGK